MDNLENIKKTINRLKKIEKFVGNDELKKNLKKHITDLNKRYQKNNKKRKKTTKNG